MTNSLACAAGLVLTPSALHALLQMISRDGVTPFSKQIKCLYHKHVLNASGRTSVSWNMSINLHACNNIASMLDGVVQMSADTLSVSW